MTLPARYTADDLAGKRVCRADLLSRHGLDGGGPLFGVVGRLDPQKGFDLVASAAQGLLDRGARLIVLGTGDARLIEGLRALAADHPDRLVVLDRFDRDEARRIYAGADMFLMPSRFEPSGLSQLIALRYGTLPLVRHTGGLADTVRDADADPTAATVSRSGGRREGLARGRRPCHRRVRLPGTLGAIQQRGMTADLSWRGAARRYEEEYRAAMAATGRPGEGRRRASDAGPAGTPGRAGERLHSLQPCRDAPSASHRAAVPGRLGERGAFGERRAHGRAGRITQSAPLGGAIGPAASQPHGSYRVRDAAERHARAAIDDPGRLAE